MKTSYMHGFADRYCVNANDRKEGVKINLDHNETIAEIEKLIKRKFRIFDGVEMKSHVPTVEEVLIKLKRSGYVSMMPTYLSKAGFFNFKGVDIETMATFSRQNGELMEDVDMYDTIVEEFLEKTSDEVSR